MAPALRLSKVLRCFCASTAVGQKDHTIHERPARLFCAGLWLSKIPELQFLHIDLGNGVFEHPVAEHAEPAWYSAWAVETRHYSHPSFVVIEPRPQLPL
jgi:hypothetical protein